MERFLPVAITLFLIAAPMHVECAVQFCQNKFTDTGAGCLTRSQRSNAYWLIAEDVENRCYQTVKEAKDAGATSVNVEDYIYDSRISSFNCDDNTVVVIKVYSDPMVVLGSDQKIYAKKVTNAAN